MDQEDPWRRAGQPTPIFLPGQFHRQRSLAGYCPWGHKQLDTTESDMTELDTTEPPTLSLSLNNYRLITPSNVLASRFPGIGSHRVGHDSRDLAVAAIDSSHLQGSTHVK